MLRLDPDEVFDQQYITLSSNLTNPQTNLELVTKNYVDDLHHENESSRRYIGFYFYNPIGLDGEAKGNWDYHLVKTTI